MTRSQNSHDINNRNKDSKYRIFVLICLIVIIIIIVICIYFLTNFKKTLDNYDDSISDTITIINEKQDEIAKQLDKVDAANTSLVKDYYSINTMGNAISYISDDHLSRNDFISIKDLLTDYSHMNLYDSSEIISRMNKIKNLININDNNIDSLYLNKEDKSNKTSEISLETTNENNYITCAGLENELIEFFDLFYPIGSIYISVNNEMPKHGTWQKLSTDRTLWSNENGDGSLLDATLPNVKGDAGAYGRDFNISGLFNRSFVATNIGKKNNGTWTNRYFSLARANSIYKDGATVRPPSIKVKMYKRVS